MKDKPHQLRRFRSVGRIPLMTCQGTNSAQIQHRKQSFCDTFIFVGQDRWKRSQGLEAKDSSESRTCGISSNLRPDGIAVREPSSEISSPLANSESSTTCRRARDSTIKRASDRAMVASQSRAVLSRLTVRIRAPLGLKTAELTSLSFWKVAPKTRLSHDFSCAAEVTSLSCWKVASSFPEPPSQSRAVLSALTVRIRAPSGLNTAELTSPSCCKVASSFPEPPPQSRAVLSALAVRIRAGRYSAVSFTVSRL